MVITMLEAKVRPDLQNLFCKTYAELTKKVPPEIEASYLIQDQKDKDLWRIVTIWKSAAALDAMRQSGETPVGVVIFNKVNAKPMLSVHSVKAVAQ